MKVLIEAIEKRIADATARHKTLYQMSQNEKEEQVERLCVLTKAVELKDLCIELEEIKRIALAEQERIVKELERLAEDMSYLESTRYGYLSAARIVKGEKS